MDVDHEDAGRGAVPYTANRRFSTHYQRWRWTMHTLGRYGTSYNVP